MLSDSQIHFFNTNGFLVVEPELVFSAKEIGRLKKISSEKFYSYSEGKNSNLKIEKNCHDLFLNYKNIDYIKNGNVNSNNLLHARRATCMGWQLECGLNSFVEQEQLQSCVKKLLKTNRLSLHTSALIKVYPGCVGEPGNLHTDLPGFVNDPINFVKNNKFVLNTLVYLNDVDDKMAPMRVSPSTHLDYLKINDYLKEKAGFKKTKKINLMNASNLGIDENVVKELNYEIEFLKGKSGTVIFMSGNLLHSATSNLSDRSRYHLNFNFSQRSDTEVRKLNYVNMLKKNVNTLDFIEKFKDKKIVNRSYSGSPYNKIINKYYELKYKIRNNLHE